MRRSRTYAAGDSTKDERIEFHGLPQGKDTKKIQTYIQNQLKEDELSGQLTLEEADPFTGSK